MNEELSRPEVMARIMVAEARNQAMQDAIERFLYNLMAKHAIGPKDIQCPDVRALYELAIGPIE